MSTRVYRAARVLTGDAGAPSAGRAVAVRDGVITAVGPEAEALAAGPVELVDLGDDATILPGFVDTHVHLVFDASPDPVGALRATPDGPLLEHMAERCRLLLDAGVTTVRDLGDRNRLAVRTRDAVAAGELPGPRIVAAGVPVTSVGGHCWYLGGEADGPDGIRRVIATNAVHGADWTKIMATGGNFTPDGPGPADPQFTPDEIAAAAAESRRHGLPVAAHAHGVEGIRAAVDAGVDSIEHCSFMTTAGMNTAPPDERDELLARIVEGGIAVCPTFGGTVDNAVAHVGRPMVDTALDLVRHEHTSGVGLVAGTDAGMPGSVFDGFALGLSWWLAAGLACEEVLERATVAAAAALGLGGVTGRVAPGAAADLLVVDGDPRADLDPLLSPRLVLHRGIPHVPRTTGRKVTS